MNLNSMQYAEMTTNLTKLEFAMISTMFQVKNTLPNAHQAQTEISVSIQCTSNDKYRLINLEYIVNYNINFFDFFFRV